MIKITDEAQHRSVLVVDDCQDSADGLSCILMHHGYEVRVAYSGADAVAEAREHAPDIVLLDLALPGMDGYEIAGALKSEFNSHAPVLVAVTGYGRELDKQMCAQAGFTHHLTKPVDPTELLDTLGKV